MTSLGIRSGRELHALEPQVERSGQRLHHERLRHARDALEQHVAAHEQRGDEPGQHTLLADDDLADLRSRRASTAARGSTGWSVTRAPQEFGSDAIEVGGDLEQVVVGVNGPLAERGRGPGFVDAGRGSDRRRRARRSAPGGRPRRASTARRTSARSAAAASSGRRRASSSRPTATTSSEPATATGCSSCTGRPRRRPRHSTHSSDGDGEPRAAPAAPARPTRSTRSSSPRRLDRRAVEHATRASAGVGASTAAASTALSASSSSSLVNGLAGCAIMTTSPSPRWTRGDDAPSKQAPVAALGGLRRLVERETSTIGQRRRARAVDGRRPASGESGRRRGAPARPRPSAATASRSSSVSRSRSTSAAVASSGGGPSMTSTLGAELLAASARAPRAPSGSVLAGSSGSSAALPRRARRRRRPAAGRPAPAGRCAPSRASSRRPPAVSTSSASRVNRSASAGPVGRSPYHARSKRSAASAKASADLGQRRPHVDPVLARGPAGHVRHQPVVDEPLDQRPEPRPAWRPSTGRRPRGDGRGRPTPRASAAPRRRRRGRRVRAAAGGATCPPASGPRARRARGRRAARGA